MKKYRAVLFDLFGTVALFNGEKLRLYGEAGLLGDAAAGGVPLLGPEKKKRG